MRRILFTILACTALSAAVPAAALAHHGRHHHKRHHHARVRHEMFIGHQNASGASGSSSGTSTAPTAGTVTSFDGTTLVITMADGNTVSGAVTNDTEVKCESPDMQQTGDNDGDDNGGGGTEQGDAVFQHSDGGGDNGGSGDQGGDNANTQSCTIAPGMAVTKAELTIDGTGAVWNEVELVSSSTSTTPTSTSGS